MEDRYSDNEEQPHTNDNKAITSQEKFSSIRMKLRAVNFYYTYT